MELTAPFYPREFRCKDTIKDENHQTKTEENFPFSTTFTSAKNKKFSKRKAINTDYQILTFFTSSKSFPKVKPKRKLRRFFKKILAKYMKQNHAERNRLSEDGQKDTKKHKETTQSCRNSLSPKDLAYSLKYFEPCSSIQQASPRQKTPLSAP